MDGVGGAHASSARFTFEGVSSLGWEPSLMLDHETWPSIHALSLTHILFVCFGASVLPWECLSHDLMAGSMHCVGLQCILAVYFVPRSSRLTSWRKQKQTKKFSDLSTRTDKWLFNGVKWFCFDSNISATGHDADNLNLSLLLSTLVKPLCIALPDSHVSFRTCSKHAWINILDRLSLPWQVPRARCHQTVTVSVFGAGDYGEERLEDWWGFELAGSNVMHVTPRVKGHPVQWQAGCGMTLQC